MISPVVSGQSHDVILLNAHPKAATISIRSTLSHSADYTKVYYSALNCMPSLECAFRSYDVIWFARAGYYWMPIRSDTEYPPLCPRGEWAKTPPFSEGSWERCSPRTLKTPRTASFPEIPRKKVESYHYTLVMLVYSLDITFSSVMYLGKQYSQDATFSELIIRVLFFKILLF